MAARVSAARPGVIVYEITATVAPELVEEWERYMREHHIPALLATGCFRSAALTRSTPGRYRMRYEADAQSDLDRYLAIHAATLRSEFAEHFPTGIELAREVWTVQQAWPATTT